MKPFEEYHSIESAPDLIVGPLSLDCKALRALTVFHTELALSKEEFGVLYMLAAQEDRALTFERLYATIWDRKDGVDRRDEARRGIDGVAAKINDIEPDFLWIEYRQETGYTFHTRWGHNKGKWLPAKNRI